MSTIPIGHAHLTLNLFIHSRNLGSFLIFLRAGAGIGYIDSITYLGGTQTSRPKRTL